MAHQILLTRKNIMDIVNMEWTPDLEEYVFTDIATIDAIKPDYGWCYSTCNQCSKLLVVKDGLFFCNICNSTCRYPMIRYKIHVRVRDESGDTTFTIYNQEAEKVVDCCAQKYVNHLGMGYSDFPKEITDLARKVFAFRIRLHDYFHQDYDFHNYRVVFLFEIDPLLCDGLYGSAKKKVRHRKGKSVGAADEPLISMPSIETVGSIFKGYVLGEVAGPAKKIRTV